jgi:hypothetical protein
MSTIRREDLLDLLRKLERERQESRAEGMKHDLGSPIARGYLGVADGIEFCIGEIAARFGIELEEIEEPEGLAPEQSAEAKPEKKMAPSKGDESQHKRKTS